jgi:hypothetical protein
MDVFPSELPPGLLAVRGIEHNIDLIPGASLPNRAAYKTNPDETKEIQRQVQDLLDCGYIHESLSPCSVPVLPVPKKDSTWRMCVDCRAINNITIRYRYLSDPGLRDCVHNIVHTGIGDRTCPISYMCCTLLACEVELVDTEGSYSSCIRVRFLS